MVKRLLLCLSFMLVCACADKTFTFEIPSGYTGWVTVQFDKAGCGDSRTVTRTTIRVQSNGMACTAIGRDPRNAWFSKFYYVENGKRTAELRPTSWGEGGMIWAESTEIDGHEYRFFVGTEKQLDAAYKARAAAAQGSKLKQVEHR